MFNTWYQAGGRMDPPFMPTKTMPYFKGRYLEIPNVPGEWEDTLELDFDVELVGVSVEILPMQREDGWDIYIGDTPLTAFKEVFAKIVPHGMYFVACVEVLEGVPIKFVYNNKAGSAKIATMDYQFLRDSTVIL